MRLNSLRGTFSLTLAMILMAQCATAATADIKSSFTQLAACLKANRADCGDYITASSFDIYRRFTSYGLLKCLPHDTAYVSQIPAGSHTIDRAKTDHHILRLLFAQEEGAWKLDIPETLQSGLGNNWEKQVHASEQVYLLMRQQMGDRFQCDIFSNLLQQETPGAR
jgi:hypothetical protein